MVVQRAAPTMATLLPVNSAPLVSALECICRPANFSAPGNVGMTGWRRQTHAGCAGGAGTDMSSNRDMQGFEEMAHPRGESATALTCVTQLEC